MTSTENTLPPTAAAYVARGLTVSAHYTMVGRTMTDELAFAEVYGAFATAEERDRILAAFPKSAGLRPSTLDVDRLRLPTIAGRARLAANGVNGGRNEAGLKRLRTIGKAATRAGITLRHTAIAGNSAPLDVVAELVGAELEAAR